jgi:hypothetical protein
MIPIPSTFNLSYFNQPCRPLSNKCVPAMWFIGRVPSSFLLNPGLRDDLKVDRRRIGSSTLFMHTYICKYISLSLGRISARNGYMHAHLYLNYLYISSNSIKILNVSPFIENRRTPSTSRPVLNSLSTETSEAGIAR